MLPKRDPRTPVKMEEQVKLPKAWIMVLCIVGAGIVAQIIFWIMGIHAIVIWPFIFAVAVLLILNDASDQSAAGIPPFQVYALFAGTLLGMSLFVFIVSQTINPWLIILGVIGVTIYLIRDWGLRKQKEKELDRRRLAGLCVKCVQPIGEHNGPEDVCRHCGTAVNAERMNLFRLGKSMSTRVRPDNARQVLTGTKPGRSQVHMQNLQQNSAYRYKRGK